MIVQVQAVCTPFVPALPVCTSRSNAEGSCCRGVVSAFQLLHAECHSLVHGRMKLPGCSFLLISLPPLLLHTAGRRAISSSAHYSHSPEGIVEKFSKLQMRPECPIIPNITPNYTLNFIDSLTAIGAMPGPMYSMASPVPDGPWKFWGRLRRWSPGSLSCKSGRSGRRRGLKLVDE